MDALFNWLQSIIDRLRFWQIIEYDELGVHTFCGRWPRKLEPGIYLICPILSTVISDSITEQVVDIRTQSVTSKDDIPLAVGVCIAYSIINPIKAWYAVTDVDDSFANDALRITEEYVSDNVYEVCKDRQKMCDYILKHVRATATNRWGLKIHWIGRTEFAKHRVLRIMLNDE